MSARAYVLLDIVDSKSEQVVQTLRGKPGVVIVDPLEGPPDVIMVIEASKRQKLAELTMGAIVSVEDMTKGLHLLPAQDRFKNRQTSIRPSGRVNKVVK